MPIAKWDLMHSGVACNSIDSIDPTATWTVFNLGLYYIAGTKSTLRRPILEWNIDTAPVVGVKPNYALDSIVSAYIEGDCLSLFGAGGRAATVTRMIRTDWDHLSSNWQRYKVGNNWTIGGAEGALTDYDPATPTPVAITTPGATGTFTWAGFTAFAQDAIDFRSGGVFLRMRLDSEADDGVDRMMAAQIGAYATAPNTLLFCVDYAQGAVSDDIPRAAAEGGGEERRPEFDHLLPVRREGRLVRGLRQGRDSFDEGVR